MVRLVIELDDEVHQQVKIKAANKRITLKEAVTLLIQEWLKKK